MTCRKVGVYLLVVAVVVFSSPIVPAFIVGSVLVAAGIALRIWTFGHLEKSTYLVTSGPYAYSRNPAYLGSLVIFCGFVLAAGSPYSARGLLAWVLGLVMLAVFFRVYLPRKVAREYPRLKRTFPEELTAHAANVPDFFPRLTPWRSGDPRRFSWTRVRANHELWWPVIMASGLVLIWVI